MWPSEKSLMKKSWILSSPSPPEYLLLQLPQSITVFDRSVEESNLMRSQYVRAFSSEVLSSPLSL